MASSCLASAAGALLFRTAARHAQRLQPAVLVPWIAPSVQQQRPRPSGLRVMSSSSTWEDDGRIPNVYADYVVYKARAAMSLKVIKPTWEKIGSGLKISREGTVLLEFANSVGTQQYDWQNKQTFALSALECATVLEAAEERRGCDFFHDPNKGGSGEGTTQKSLSIKPGEKSGWFFNLNVSTSGAKNYVSCNVSDAELRLIRTLFNYLIPHLLGFDEHFHGTPVVVGISGAAAQPDGEGPPF